MKTKNPFPVPDATPDAGAPAQEDKELASLLRAAGPRPAPPEKAQEIVKAAALAQWQWTVRQEQRRRRFRWAAVALAAAATLAFVSLQPALRSQLGFGSRTPVGTLEVALGEVLGGEGSELSRLTAGEVLRPGSVVETPGKGSSGSRAIVQLAGGSALRLDAGSRLRVLSGGVLALDRGAVYVDSGPAGKAVEIRTPLGEVRDIGTRFEVRLEEGLTALRVRVRDGEVELEHRGAAHVASAGEELLQKADGSLARTEVEPYGEAWEWVAATLPPFEIEGRSLAEYLSWAAHEGGWRLRYVDPALESYTGEIILHGSVDRLSLEEAVSGLFAGSGLYFQIEAGELTVGSAR